MAKWTTHAEKMIKMILERDLKSFQTTMTPTIIVIYISRMHYIHMIWLPLSWSSLFACEIFHSKQNEQQCGTMYVCFLSVDCFAMMKIMIWISLDVIHASMHRIHEWETMWWQLDQQSSSSDAVSLFSSCSEFHAFSHFWTKFSCVNEGTTCEHKKVHKSSAGHRKLSIVI